MTILFRVKRLTETAKLPHRNCESDLWDLFADGFCDEFLQDHHTQRPHNFDGDIATYATIIGEQKAINDNVIKDKNKWQLLPQGRILVKTGIALDLPKQYQVSVTNTSKLCDKWFYKEPKSDIGFFNLKSYAVADIRPRSGLALKHGITVLNSPATIDNSYRKEIGIILINNGHEPYTITKGDKICQMLIRPLYLSSFEEVKDFEDTGRGAYGSTGK